MDKADQKETSAIWDSYWQDPVPTEMDIFVLAKEEHTISWQRIEKEVLGQFGSFEGLKVIEIGAGTGTNSALMAKRGAHATILDNSEKALLRSKNFYARNGLEADFLKENAFELPEEMLGKFDVSMSFGFAEHFSGPERQGIIKTHFDLLKNNGMAIISVPNKYNPPYRIFKFLGQKTNHWPVGDEYPFSRNELARYCKNLNIPECKISGDSFASSINFLLPNKRSFIRKRLGLQNKYDISKLKMQRGSFLDQYLAYALILSAIKR